MVFAAGLRFFNHLLREEPWASARLRPFAGRRVRLVCGSFDERLAITDGGLFEADKTEGEPVLTLTLPADAPLRVLLDRGAVERDLKLDGAADLAEALGFVLRNLEWDIEADLTPLVGDLAAHRLVAEGRRLAAVAPDWLGRFAANLGSVLADSPAPLVSRPEFERLRRDLGALEAVVDRLDDRLKRLGG